MFVLPKLAVCAVAVAVGAALLMQEGSRSWDSLRSSVDAPLAAFCAVSVVAAVISIDARLSWFATHQDIFFSLAGLAGCVAAFYLGRAGGRYGAMGAAVRGVVGASIVVSVLAILQTVGLDVFKSQFWVLNRRVSSTFGNPVVLGAYFALIIPLAGHLSLQRGGVRRWSIPALLLAVVALLLTGTRASFLGGVAGGGLYVMLRFKSRRMRAILIAVGAAAVLFAGAFLMRNVSRMTRGDSGRLQIWRIALIEFSEHPWLGLGPNTFSITHNRLETESLARSLYFGNGHDNAHNDWLQVLSTTGLAGMIAYLWLHAAAFAGARRALRADGDGNFAALISAVVAVWVHAKFNPPSFAVAWLAALFAGGVLAAKRSTSRGAPLLVAASAGFFFLLVGLVNICADRQDYLGISARRAGRMREAARYFEAAIAINPDRVDYRYHFANLLWDVSKVPEARSVVSDRKLLLVKASETAREAVRRHPYNVNLNLLLGLAEERRAVWGGEDRLGYARAALDRAYADGPFFKKTVVKLIRVAELQGDLTKKKKLEERLRRLGG